MRQIFYNSLFEDRGIEGFVNFAVFNIKNSITIKGQAINAKLSGNEFLMLGKRFVMQL